MTTRANLAHITCARLTCAQTLCGALLLAGAVASATAAPLVIAGVRGLSEKEAGTVIITEAYRRIGVDIVIKSLPARSSWQTMGALMGTSSVSMR